MHDLSFFVERVTQQATSISIVDKLRGGEKTNEKQAYLAAVSIFVLLSSLLRFISLTQYQNLVVCILATGWHVGTTKEASAPSTF